MYISNIITHALVNLLINLANQRALLGIINMIYDRPSEMVPEQFFGSYVVVFLQSQDNKTYSGFSIQYATC